jgi:uncharacterized membrane protein (UPF0136 family)
VLKSAQIVYFVYAAELIIGGILGASKSIISLIAGVVCGLLALAAGVLVPKSTNVGLLLALLAALAVGGSMLPRFLKAPKVFPSGVTLALSLIVLVVTVAVFFSARPAANR